MRVPQPLSRRQFLEGATAIAGMGTALSALSGVSHAAAAAPAAPARAAATRAPVVSFYMDRPYLDPTGMAEPYVPPAGTRSGQPLTELSDEEFRGRHPY
jgi:hypothetical protein